MVLFLVLLFCIWVAQTIYYEVVFSIPLPSYLCVISLRLFSSLHSLSLFAIAALVLACSHTYLAFGYNILGFLEVLSVCLQPIYFFVLSLLNYVLVIPYRLLMVIERFISNIYI